MVIIQPGHHAVGYLQRQHDSLEWENRPNCDWGLRGVGGCGNGGSGGEGGSHMTGGQWRVCRIQRVDSPRRGGRGRTGLDR